MDNTVISISDKNPEFIEWQKLSVDKFCKDAQYIVFNNAIDKNIRNKINETCQNLGVSCVEIDGDYSKDGSNRHADAMRTVWNQHLKNINGNLLWIDNDMFLISDFDLQNMGEKYDVGYSPIYRKDNSIECMWAGVLFFNLETMDRGIDFSITTIEGFKTDTGGMTYHYIHKHPEYRKIIIQNHTIYDFDDHNLKTQLNGCTGYIEFVDGKPVKEYCSKRFFPYEKENDNYLEEYFREYNTHKEIVEKFKFPKPYDFDLLKPVDGEYFLFHFKSASWADRYGDGNNSHAQQKKDATMKLLGIEKKNG